MDYRASNEQQSASVLIVDDEGANRYSISRTLERIGYIVNEASDGEEALRLIRERGIENPYDVVLTDIRMTGIDGIELLRHIKAESPDSIVILMTGYASLGSAVEALRLGAFDYLIKPSSSHDIRQSIVRGVEQAQSLKRRRALLQNLKESMRELTREDVLEQQQSYDDDYIRPARRVPDYSEEKAVVFQNQTSVEGMNLGPLTVYTGRYQVAVDDEPIDLTPTEFDLLLYLAAHRGRVVSCQELVREIRGYALGEDESREVIRPHISNLRSKLKKAGEEGDLIVNVRGIGYRLSDKAGL